MVHGSSLAVQSSGRRSTPVQLSCGAALGRRLSPAFFAATGRLFADAVRSDHVGIGLDPPREGVIAYHLAKSGTDSDMPKAHLALQLSEAVAAGKLSWDDAMQAAEDDASRLRLLDLASSVRIPFQQYIDDSRVKASSWGALCGVGSSLT